MTRLLSNAVIALNAGQVGDIGFEHRDEVTL
jgi:hypothetical protein